MVSSRSPIAVSRIMASYTAFSNLFHIERTSVIRINQWAMPFSSPNPNWRLGWLAFVRPVRDAQARISPYRPTVPRV
jgi:hypothetical protein